MGVNPPYSSSMIGRDKESENFYNRIANSIYQCLVHRLHEESNILYASLSMLIPSSSNRYLIQHEHIWEFPVLLMPVYCLLVIFLEPRLCDCATLGPFYR